MKRLFSVIAFATLVAMCLVACKQNEVKLHQDVGRVYGTAHGDMGGDGIVFYVDEGAGYALVCSMNDLRRDRLPDAARAAWEKDFTWSVFGSDTVMERDTIWCEITRSIRYFTGREERDTVINGREEHLLRYNYENRDEDIKIYPMLRYKAYTEKDVQVCPPFTKDTAYNAYIGELVLGDTVLRRIDTTFKRIFDSINLVVDTVEEVVDSVKEIYENDEFVKFDTVWRNDTTWKNDTVRARDTITKIDSVYWRIETGYSDTLWNHIKKGDRKIMDKGEWKYALDTNWSFSRIGIGEEDPSGQVNTDKILKADVPCRQKATPDSSSAARTCYKYYTNNYYEGRSEYAADTFYKAGQNEWFLPSRAELRHLFDARKTINETHANTKGFEPLQECYWSSNERDAKNAWYKCFSDNGVESYIPKANNNYRVNVRAVRKVKWPLK